MNTYQEKLLSATEITLGTLISEKASRRSEENCAEFNYYFSQGVKLASQAQLEQITEECATVQAMNEQVVANDSLAKNLLKTVKESEKSTQATIKNTQTAAKNVQVAANAVAKLASDIGSALNIVFAADYGTDIAKMTQSANDLVREAAYKAESASQTAMEASTMTAEITAKQVTDGTVLVNKSVQTLLKATQKQLGQLEVQKTADSAKYAETLITDKSAKGVLLDCQSQLQAINNSHARSNRELNYNLMVTPRSLSSIALKFTPFSHPFSSNHDQENTLAVPKADAQHFICLVKASKRGLFNMDAANLNFSQYQDQRFISVNENEAQLDLANKLDSDGDAIEPGVNYVVFLYVELSLSYKKFTHDYSDLLSAPSELFSLDASLPGVTKDIQYTTDKDGVSEIQFTVEGDIPKCAEFRCMFVMENTPHKGAVLIVDEDGSHSGAQVHPTENKHSGIHLTTAIAEHVSVANYIVAKSIGANTFKAKVSSDVTDNFGYKIIPGRTYSTAILATQPAGVSSQPYTSTLSKPTMALADGADAAPPELAPNKNTKTKGKATKNQGQ